MADDYPYMVSNNKIKPIIEAIHNAAKPPKFSHEFLKQIGFSSSNDRAVIPLFKRLGFLTDSGTPTTYYDDLKDTTKRWSALGARIKDLYSDLYAINTKIHGATEDEVKGAMSRVTGKDAKAVGRYYATFKTLCDMAKFDSAAKAATVHNQEDDLDKEDKPKNGNMDKPVIAGGQPGFHYNIQIHLPATTDISVYNAIFKSLKENLNI
ncbi:hypothetical protein DT594_14560 [Halopseudomonas laoshanensis]|uniref:DUF5343 domain-containing protein n=1 Tax=Halopseudomonas laoshanensis TaxID=2268758 RepID=A0A7V7KWB2_9GAMM|nr:DUF5343 domain-containing protein [Halopseudomonas laoshanensis]KAA0693601.1 hypothetical protein DT594_14560 [Halopseudomonas laoshanensis]